MKKSLAQSSLEYAVGLGVIISVFFLGGGFVRRGFQARHGDALKYVIEEANKEAARQGLNQFPYQYEPGYLQEDMPELFTALTYL